MSVSFFAHRQKLLDAYKDVLDDKSETNWALFSYEGNQNELKVQSTGDEGLDELESEFNSGKIMYAFVQIDDPNTNLKKFILIVWQGDGVPATRKGACANHVKDISRFFQGSHLTIYARNDDDVAPDEIMRQVTKSTSNFTFVAPKNDYSDQKSVGSVYKRINPEQEIKSTRNEAFWDKVQKEEDDRKKQEKQREMERRKREAAELKEREAKSELNRNQLIKEREKEITEKMKAQKLADNQKEIRSQEIKRFQEQEKDQQKALVDQRRTRRSQSIEHAHEAEQLVSQRSNNPRAMWAQREKEANAPPPARKVSSSGSRTSSINEQPEVERPPVDPVYLPEPASTYTCQDNNYSVDPDPEPEPEPEPAAEYEPESVYAEPAQQDYNQSYEAAQQGHEEQYTDEAVYNEPEENPASGSVSARALYDYQAEDDTEITFDPGDVITGIEQIDEGWWRGYAPNGSYGLFPANYVELM